MPASLPGCLHVPWVTLGTLPLQKEQGPPNSLICALRGRHENRGRGPEKTRCGRPGGSVYLITASVRHPWGHLSCLRQPPPLLTTGIHCLLPPLTLPGHQPQRASHKGLSVPLPPRLGVRRLRGGQSSGISQVLGGEPSCAEWGTRPVPPPESLGITEPQS